MRKNLENEVKEKSKKVKYKKCKNLFGLQFH